MASACGHGEGEIDASDEGANAWEVRLVAERHTHAMPVAHWQSCLVSAQDPLTAWLAYTLFDQMFTEASVQDDRDLERRLDREEQLKRQGVKL